MTDVREGVHMMLCKYLHHHLAPSRIWFIENEEISFTSFEHSKVSNRRYVCKLKCPNQIKPGSPKNLWFSTDLMWHKKYQSFFCVTCKVVKVAANGNLPFNLHLDFWKSRSWKIKVCFILWNYFRSCKPGFFFSVCHLDFFQVYDTNQKKKSVDKLKNIRTTEKRFRCAGPENFLFFNFSRP